VSKIFLHCCIARLEADSDKLANGYLFNKLDGEKVENIYKEHKYWLKAPYADNYLDNYKMRKKEESFNG
jgi:hypothetical protein